MKNNAECSNNNKYFMDTKTQELTSIVFVMNPNDLRTKKERKKERKS